MIFFNNRHPNSTVVSHRGKRPQRIARFVDGRFETKNEVVIEKLKKHFRYEESPKVLTNIAHFLKLRKKVAALGINTFGMKKKDLIKALEESEKNE